MLFYLIDEPKKTLSTMHFDDCGSAITPCGRQGDDMLCEL